MASATRSGDERAADPPPSFRSAAAAVSKYRVPLALFALGLVFQLVVLPASFPSTHYNALGLRRFATVDEVTAAYENLESKWNSGSELPTTTDFIKVRYAFELLTNPLWKRDYDLFGIDEYNHIIGKAKVAYNSMDFSDIALPLISVSLHDTLDAFNVLTSEQFISKVGNATALLVQIYSDGSFRSAQFFKSWERIAGSFVGVAEVGMVELGQFDIVSYLAERKPTKQPFFPKGLPSFVAFPPNCRHPDCYVRYQGDLSEYEIADWMATDIVGLPRIRYYSKDSLVPDFIVKSARHKVKVIYFSATGVRLAPFFRKAAKDYWAYASFASVFWREQDASIWWNLFQVESAPALVFLKDPGVKPFVYHGNLNSSLLTELIERNKHFELPQLRSMTSMELGCDAKGYSRSGNDTLTWYCVILAGRPSLELNKMRETTRNAQGLLQNVAVADDVDTTIQTAFAEVAFKDKRLTFAWLDGESQKDYCYFYLHSETVYETCGPRRYGDPTDTPRLFIVRYKQRSIESNPEKERRPKNIWDAFLEEDDANHASQLVARYNGSEDINEIVTWISKTIEDGETRDLPEFVGRSPQLIPEDSNPVWSKGAESIVSAGKGMKHNIRSMGTKMFYYMADPRVGPALLLGACLSLGAIWLQGNQTPLPAKKNKDAGQANDERQAKDEVQVKDAKEVNNTEQEKVRRRRDRKTRRHKHDVPPSITDFEPKDAVQVHLTDSDSD